MKTIPLSEPMGGDCSCCVHDDQCKAIVESINDDIQFRCPLTIEVDDDIEYAGERHDSCFSDISSDSEDQHDKNKLVR